MNSVADTPEPQLNPLEQPPVVLTSELRKVYRTGFWLNQKVVSLKSCSLQVYPGQTFGLLGPNGAGKTTLLKLLLGIIRPSSGRGLLLGKPIGDRSVKQKIGYLPENPYLYDYLTGWEFLQLAAGLFQIPRQLQRQRIPQLLELVGLSQVDARKKLMRRYSKGMLQRVGMAQALINDPDLVFLDEPMSGLDPLGRYQMREIILSLKAAGKTIFFNSHVLSEVEQICDRVAILNQGELICSGSLNELLGTENSYHVKGLGGDGATLKKRIPDLEFKPDGSWHGILQDDYYDFLASLRLMGGEIITMNLSRQSLEEFFIQQIQKQNH
ncbi:ABC transporter ATP-binding protein [Anabaena cylindrica FACHB-243]|uniref:Fe(3+)-transporting ATPase n=1 Tax=Anabaena cylindrica (strain ATCC 27899 / PCC 7122) TaxID=272123 RepID=K9ZHG4_ANACC|nr:MULTISPECIES: ABC transporter ATP-binding protein [Anabaena]AFZ58017.1 Fe(3+)-transporting ATPase [Anabaena cylindrica PCC 7122]MBD2420737.1 ABC transporter ATP-binding protein [Anabaena cylindrica FACHB-243]MBY5311733.1 ABC transporter ATP-binding protein [Anabaena sp. CCAP 1446/1C]MCM2408246.1 ABC transporter ATP-binding protein [Anabaena sp. CCAP 1446/1C]BAY05017.1 ABC transporter-like protein [Anabaena cylindrica PCC 7122]